MQYSFNVTGATREAVLSGIADQLEAVAEVEAEQALAAVTAYVDIVGEAEGAELSVTVGGGVGAEDGEPFSAALSISVSRFIPA